MFRERSNLALKREKSMLADMGQSPEEDFGINVAMAGADQEDASYDSMMADAESKYSSGDYEGALMVYSMALGSYPERTEILDGLTRAQTALENKLANPDQGPSTSGPTRVSEGQASTPSGPSRSGTRVSPGGSEAPVHGLVSQNSFYPSREPSIVSPTPASRASRATTNAPSRAISQATLPEIQTPVASRPPSQADTGRYSSQTLPPMSAMSVSSPPIPSRAGSRVGAMSAASPAPGVSVAAAASIAASSGGRSSRARPESGRYSTRPSSAVRAASSRPITPAGDHMDAQLFAVTQLGKIEEDMAQELWDRCKERCERFIEQMHKTSKEEMDTEEKETYMASVYNSLGRANFAMGNMDQALEDHNLALHIAGTYGLYDVKAVADEAIGRIHMSIGREASTVWEETIRIDKEVRPKSVAPSPVPGNLTRTKTILASEDSPTMVDIAMPAAVASWQVQDDIDKDLESMLREAEGKYDAGDYEGALMLYSTAQTQYPDEPEVEEGLRKAEAALQRSMEGMTSRAAGDKKVHFDGGWAPEGDVEDAPVYLDPEEDMPTLRKYATKLDQVEADLVAGNYLEARDICEEFLERFGSLKDDATLAERFTYLATAHNQLGRALAALGESTRAREEHTAALQIADRNGLDDLKLEALDLLARLYLADNEIDEAVKTWKQCIPICPGQSEKSEIYYKMALAELSHDNYMQSRINGDKAAMAAVKAGHVSNQINAHVVIGMTLAKTGDRVGALEEYKKALELAKSIDDVAKEQEIQERIDALESGDLEGAAAPPAEAIIAVAVVASATSSRSTSRQPSRVVSPATSRRSSRAPSPTRRQSSSEYHMEDETEILSPRGIDASIKSPRGSASAVVTETMLLLQMYILYTLPEF